MIKRIFKLLVAIIILAGLLYMATYLYVRLPSKNTEKVEMSIEPGTSVSTIAERLEKHGIIKCVPCFRVYIALTGLSSKLRAGDYTFEPSIHLADVITKLLKGDFKTYRLTIPEGWTLKEVASYISTLDFIKSSDFQEKFLQYSVDSDFISSLDIGWKVDDLEGYLFPSTYEVYRIHDPRKIITLMTNEFKVRFTSKILKKSHMLDIEPHEIVILASIIEKESSIDSEKPLIASVFYNRLKKKMLLQSDPTVIYGLKDFDGNLTKADLLKRHSYNTYVFAGLPEGAICNPGAESINAALNPAETNYLYFVSKNNGSHHFSKDYKEHLRAVNKYQIRGETGE